MALTDREARQAKPKDKDYKLADSRGLHLFVRTTGTRSWRMKYRFGGKEKVLTIGPYPEVGLANAREQCEEARRQLRENVDPSVAKKKARAAAIANTENTFEQVARRWHAYQLDHWSKAHAETVIESMERDLFGPIGNIPVTEVDPPLVLSVLRPVERRGAVETAHRLRQRMSAVFVRAISEGICRDDPAATVAGALKPISKKSKQPAIMDLPELRDLLRKVEGSKAEPITKLASRMIALTAVRPAVIRGAVWSEFEGIDWLDPEGDASLAQWRIPADRMKLERDQKFDKRNEHIVPLPFQAVAVLHTARRLTGRSPLVFPSVRHALKPMSENAIGYMYNRAGYHGRHVPHGWRASFSTIMNERAERAQRPSDRAVIDLMLAHIPAGTSGSEGAYNRAAYMARRRELAVEWADLLLSEASEPNQLINADAR
ncbi:MAG: integrase arm-type DNA-binding domain-containing protein [Sphingomonadaceae bacterium]|nr:integrase arm-type DNA-binding domain-containing protein [Sphingomonadaceae bacterium]